MTANDGLKQALQDSLTQLANSFQANETSITVEQIAECFEHLQAAHRTALDRLFFLIYQHNHHIDSSSPGSCAIRGSSARFNRCDHAIQEQPNTSTTQSALGSGAAASPRSQSSTASSRRIHQSRPNINASSETAVRPAHSDRRLTERSNDQRRILPPTNPTTRSDRDPGPIPKVASPHARRQLPGSGLARMCIGAEEPIRCTTDITFPVTIEALLQTCVSDPSAFLRAVTEGKVSLPDGQGWEAAIVTKSNNADMRDLTRIFHRFECYNIYQHVVEAGYHTGSHWIRDMRSLLAARLSHSFPSHFTDQKAANKCLQWVDQGCRYREWAEKLSGSAVNLGYLVALPCNVPHSTYTSRCTKEQIVTAVLELKRLGIARVVEQMKLSVLANHIVNSLRDMTAGKRADSGEGSADATPKTNNDHHPCTRAVVQLPPPMQPRCGVQSDDMPSSMIQADRSITSPELAMLDVSECTFDAFEDAWLEEWAGREPNVSTTQRSTAVVRSTFPPSAVTCTDLPSPAMSNRTIRSPSNIADPFSEWYQQ